MMECPECGKLFPAAEAINDPNGTDVICPDCFKKRQAKAENSDAEPAPAK